MQFPDDKTIHHGHRHRMRAKLSEHGARIFDTYELLEMLLYYVIPYKDTNPIAKRLLLAFGSLDGVFRASEEELATVSGIGECAAHFIKRVGELSDMIGAEPYPKDDGGFDTYTKLGEHFVSILEGESEPCVVMLLLDNSMKLIAAQTLYRGVDYESSAVRSELFVAMAARHGAAMAAIAHNHVHGPCYPTLGDRATDNLISRALASAGVRYLEHFIVSGKNYVGISRTGTLRMSHPLPNDFLDGTEDGNTLISDIARHRAEILYDLLLPVKKEEARELVVRLLDKYHTAESLLAVDFYVMSEEIGESAALAVKLYAHLCARRVTDKLKFGKTCGIVDVVEHFKALYIPASVETVYIMTFDKGGCPIGCEYIGEGTVNSSEVLPRRILNVALRAGAASIVVAHNHPHGIAEPSAEDLQFNALLSHTLGFAKINLTHHVIVAGQSFDVIACMDTSCLN